MRHPRSTIDLALGMVASGATHRTVAEATGVSIDTLRTWLYRRVPHRPYASDLCDACGAPAHDFLQLPPEVYAYLLAMYLGDGTIFHFGKGVYVLRVTLDTAYPGIIEECRVAMGTIRDGRGAHASRDSRGQKCVHVTAYWKQWPCYFPQHGPGRKHHRPIVLEPWQQELVDAAPGKFLRGLIHTDGWRGLNRVTVKGRDYAYPRYQFSNRSEDIRRLFTDTCDKLGIEWRRWGPWHISVARRDAVARLDEFVGPKT